MHDLVVRDVDSLRAPYILDVLVGIQKRQSLLDPLHWIFRMEDGDGNPDEVLSAWLGKYDL